MTDTTTNGIGAQDSDLIEMHYGDEGEWAGMPAGWVWAECLRESRVMRQEAWARLPFTVGTNAIYHLGRGGAWELFTQAERERGIPAW